MEVLMFRKVLAVSMTGLLLSGVITATSASAGVSVSNGVPCPKINATTKVGSSVYKCAKNPTVKNAKLTWVSMDCLNANASYVKANNSYIAYNKKMPTTLADLDLKIAAEQTNAMDQVAKADALDLKIADFELKVTEYTASRQALLDDKANAIANSKPIATFTAAIGNLKKAIRLDTLSSANYRKAGKTVTTMQATRAQVVAQLAQAKDGVSQALSMRALVCSKGL